MKTKKLKVNVTCEILAHIIGVPEGKERGNGVENLFEETMVENFPNLGRDLDIQVYKSNRSPQNVYTKQSSPRKGIIKLFKIKDKEKILKATRGKIRKFS